jgi:putative tryptophan/tyrosine transport system substrate-binding protein
MIRACACLLFFVGLTVASHADDSTRSGRVPRIGYLATHTTWTPYFNSAMKNLGYREGENLVVVWRASDQAPAHLQTVAQELVALGVDLILVDSTPGALAAKGVTEKIPIVFAGLADPVASGLVASLPRPGGNVTGATILSRDVMAKRVQLLKEAAPAVSALAIVWNPTHPHGPVLLKDAEAAAAQLGLKALRVPVRGARDVDSAFAMIGKRGYGLLLTDDTLLINQAERLALLAAERRLPAISGFREFVENGGLMSYGPSLVEQFEGAALYADKILKGAHPADLPVIQASRFELLVNLKTAKEDGLTLPQSILLSAHEVIR